VTLAASVDAGPDAVDEVGRQVLSTAPGDLFTPLPRPYTWDDLVLPATVAAHLREVESHIRLRGAVYDEWGYAALVPLGRGVAALFAGPSGTGKTMAAQVLARSLDLELYRVDLAGVVNKYIGETEKRLKQVFDRCERTNVLVLFDEADALFGRRMQVKDAHDRFANIEIDYLLQRMERFDGTVILASNRKTDLDSAFLRRLRFIVDFVEPGPTERRRLWQQALIATSPTGAPLLDAIDLNAFATRLSLTGAEIKNAAIGAAFRARDADRRIATADVIAAVQRELAKRSVVLREDWAAIDG
jgi:SpoVK/Ycf46/Vps4 family AAA+-type ATPase